MSRPPGPPPYTAAQIAGLSTPTERFIAQAELNSYITGHKLADLREKGLLGHPYYSMTFGAAPHGNTEGHSGRSDSSHDGSHNNSDVDSYHTPNSSGSVRGSGRRGGTRGSRAGRGYGGFQPYPRTKLLGRNEAPPTVEFFQDENPSDAFGSRVGDESKQSHGTPVKSTTLCPAFTSTGKCARLRCPDIHDADKLALCKRFLYKAECPKGDRCQLSHRSTSNNTPNCLYYLDGRCTNPSCQFIHVDVDPTALVCNSFGRVGYCERGEQCIHLHVYECPEFANEGTCAAGEGCALRHIHHASRMKARRSPGTGTPRSNQDINSGGSVDEANLLEDTHAITQQHDYVPFHLDD